MSNDKELLNIMLSEIKKLDKIALLKEEDNVIRAVIRGNPRTKILKQLQDKYPNEQITANDIDNFLLTYRDIIKKESVDIEKTYVRRLIKSKAGLNNELIDLALQAKDMARRYDADGDNSNAIAAVRTVADILMKFAKVEGLTTEQPEVNINMQMDRVVQNIASNNNQLTGNLKAILDIDAEIVDEEVDGKKTK